MAYAILYDRECLQKDIRRLDPSILKRIKNSIETRLAEAPTEFGKPLRHSAEGLWSLRIGDWRVIYKIAGDRVWVLRIGHRREVYKIF